jgi:DNA-binding NtrC family response regulator
LTTAGFGLPSPESGVAGNAHQEIVMNEQYDFLQADAAVNKPPILIIDDDRDTCELMSYFLSFDFTCDTAFDGAQAFRKIREREYSVIVVDLMLPIIDGFTLIRSAAEKSPATPVIVVSAVAEVQAAIKAMKIGAFAYIVKPFEPEQVEISVKRAFNHHLYLQSEMELSTSAPNRD